MRVCGQKFVKFCTHKLVVEMTLSFADVEHMNHRL